MTLEKILRWVVLLGVFALPFVPLIVTTSLFFPYITGKNFAFRAIVEVMAGLWLALALVDAKYRPKRGWILGCFALFILVIAIADAQGANPFKSFWSNYERMDGWVTIAHLFLYLVVASVMMNTEKLWQRLFQFTLAISACLSIYGLWQVAGSAGLATRIDATFGNPIYLAVYMLFNIFIATLLIAQEGKQQWGTMERIALPLALVAGFVCIAPQASSVGLLFLIGLVSIAVLEALMFLRRQYVLGFVIVLDIIALFLTGTRGTELGLIGGTLLAILLYAFIQGSRKVRIGAVACVVVVAVLAGGLRLAHNTPFVNSIGFLDRLASISLTDDTIYARLLNISIASKGVLERPVFGWGQENYAIVFDKYYDPRMYAQEPWFDRVHNIIFDWLVAGGILGLATYLSIFAATLWVLWKKAKAGTHAFSVLERSIITGLLAGYFIHNLSVFDNITSYILFGTVLGYIVWRRNAEGDALPLIKGEIFSKVVLPFTAVGMVLVTIGVVWMVNGNAYAENRTLLLALEQQADPSANLALFQQAIGYGTYGTQEAREQLVQTAAQVASLSAAQVPNAMKQQYFDLAVSQMMLQEKASPLDARFPLFIGTVEDSFGDYTDASTSLESAHQLSPAKQSILFQIGSNDSALNDLKGSEQAFKQAYELDTEDQQALVYYIAAAVRASDDATADKLLTPAVIASGVAANQQLAAAYASRNQYGKIIPIWTAEIAVNPSDTTAYTTLAAAYYETGNSAQAIAVLQQLAKVSPSSSDQVKAFIQQIQSGTIKVQ
jgi:O-antigen ligase/tetratricopeptide (TPR) repeat protein